MSQYRKGYRHECYVRDRLRREGWMVFRCAGSKPIDLIAMKWDTQGQAYRVSGRVLVRLIECKAGKSRVRKEDRVKFKEIQEKLGITVEVM